MTLKLRGLLLCGLFFLLAGSAYSQGPTLPYRDAGACPFECCTYRQWTANKETVIYREMREGSVRSFSVNRGEKVTGVTGVVITTKAGVAKVSANTTIGQRKIPVKAGDTLYTLTYRGEGFFKTWYRGRLVGDVEYGNPKIKQVSQPEAVWWVKIRNRKGQVGWSKLPDNFDHKDSCGD